MNWDSKSGKVNGILRIQEPKQKPFFPKIKDILAERLQMCLNLSTVITGHGKLRAYLHRFKIIDEPMRPCEMNPQDYRQLNTGMHLIEKAKTKTQKSYHKGGRELANIKH